MAELLIGLVIYAAVLGYPFLQARALLRMRGGWRYAAAAPLLIMLPILPYTIYALMMGSNLWPLLLIFGSIPSAAYVAAVMFAHQIVSEM